MYNYANPDLIQTPAERNRKGRARPVKWKAPAYAGAGRSGVGGVGHVILGQEEQGDPLLTLALHDLTGLDHLRQERGALLTGDAQLGSDLAAAEALQGVGQVLQNAGLDLGVLPLGLGGLVALGGVALDQLVTEGGQLLHGLFAVKGMAIQLGDGDDGVLDCGDVGDLIHGINPFPV